MLRVIVEGCVIQPNIGDFVFAPDIGKGEVSGSDFRLFENDLLFSEAGGAPGIEVVDGQGDGPRNMRPKVDEQCGEDEDGDRGDSAKGQRSPPVLAQSGRPSSASGIT